MKFDDWLFNLLQAKKTWGRELNNAEPEQQPSPLDNLPNFPERCL